MSNNLGYLPLVIVAFRQTSNSYRGPSNSSRANDRSSLSIMMINSPSLSCQYKAKFSSASPNILNLEMIAFFKYSNLFCSDSSILIRQTDRLVSVRHSSLLSLILNFNWFRLPIVYKVLLEL